VKNDFLQSGGCLVRPDIELTKVLAAFAIVALATFAAPSAECQQQSYRIGGTRVTQGSNLARPTDTYITRGTLSPSAQIPVYGSAPVQPASRYPQGYLTPAQAANNQQQGSQQMGGLPNARMGATVGMPGDYMRSDLNPNYSLRKQEVRQNGYVTIPTQVQAHQNRRAPVATYNRSNTPSSSGQATTSTATYSGSSGGKEFKGY
jgi:hypothetical protein